jgi:hypothetical protein
VGTLEEIICSNHPYDAYRLLIAAGVVLQTSAQFWLDAAGDKDLAKMLRAQSLHCLASAERLRHLFAVQFENPWPSLVNDQGEREKKAWQELEVRS